jgi:hypothetical protein
MLSKQRIRLFANGTPKLGELLRRKPFNEQRVEFFRCSREARHGPLFNGSTTSSTE